MFPFTSQDCVQLNQYTLKDEIGKVRILGAGLVLHIQREGAARAGSGRGVLGGEVGREGFVINGPFVLFSFEIVILMCFCKSTESILGNLLPLNRVIVISTPISVVFFLPKVLSHLFLLLFQPVGVPLQGLKAHMPVESK